MKSLAQRTGGFTLVELIVIAPILMITIVVLMGFLFNQFGQLTQEGARLKLVTDAQLITLSMQDDVFFASAFMGGLNPGLADVHEPEGGWTNATTPQTLIVSVPALTGSNRDPNRQAVYINSEGCEAENLELNAPLLHNVVFFVDGNRLYKRTISAPDDMATCGTPYDKQTCPEEFVTNDCPRDILLTDKLNLLEITYYDSNNNEVTDPEQARRIKVDVELKDRAFAEDIYGRASITMKKLN